ncbi:hypothetical protein Hanom_Chr09g00769301 [Helianthus anomalus]
MRLQQKGLALQEERPVSYQTYFCEAMVVGTPGKRYKFKGYFFMLSVQLKNPSHIFEQI